MGERKDFVFLSFNYIRNDTTDTVQPTVLVGLTTINISIVNVVVRRSMYLLHLVALSPNHRSWAFGLSRIDARTMCIFFHLVCSLGGFLFVFVWLTSSLHRHTLLSYGSIVSSSFAFESAQSTLCVCVSSLCTDENIGRKLVRKLCLTI